MIPIQIIGRLGADPEVRYTADGRKITTLRVAVNIREKGENVTIWWQVSFWGEENDKIMSHLKKGSAVIIMAEMQQCQIWNERISYRATGRSVGFSPFGGKNDPDVNNQQPPVSHQQEVKQTSKVTQGGNDFDMGFTEDDVPF